MGQIHRRGRKKEEGRGQDAVGTFYLQRRASPYNVDAVQITSYLPGSLFRFDSIHFFLLSLFFSFSSFHFLHETVKRRERGTNRHEMIYNFVKRGYIEKEQRIGITHYSIVELLVKLVKT